MTINDVIYDLKIAESLARECDEYYDMDNDLEEIAETIENCIDNLESIIQELEYIEKGINELI